MRACVNIIPAILLSCIAVCAVAGTPEDKPDSKAPDSVLETLPTVIGGTSTAADKPADKESLGTHGEKEGQESPGSTTGMEQLYSPEALKEMADAQKEAMREQIKNMTPEEKKAFRQSLLDHMSKEDRAQYNNFIDSMSMKKQATTNSPPAPQ